MINRIKWFWRFEVSVFPWRLKRLARWIPVLWHQEDCDYACLLEIVEHKMGLMESRFRTKGRTVGSSRSAKQLLIAKILVRRIIDEQWLDQWDKYSEDYAQNEARRKYWHNHAKYMMNQDVELLANLIRKHLLTWWD